MPRNDGERPPRALRVAAERPTPIKFESTEDWTAYLAALYESEHRRLVAISARTLPAEEQAAAEDVVQTVFEEAARACVGDSSFRPGRGWLLRRLRSRIADRYRRSKRLPRMEPLEPVTDNRDDGSAVDPTPTPEERAVGDDHVRQLLKTIPDPIDRAALKLKLEGFTEAEIAARLALNHEAREVRDRLGRVRQRALAWRTTT